MYDLPHQVSSNPVSCVKPSHTESERKVYMKKAGLVTFSPACRALPVLERRKLFFILSFKKNQNHTTDKDSRRIHLFFKMLSPKVLWFALKHSGVPLARGLSIVFLIKEDSLVCTYQMSTGIVLLSTQIKCHATKKQLRIIFILPHPTCLPLCLRSLSGVLQCWCAITGDSQGRVKSLRRKIMVTITAMFMAVSQIQ